MNSKVLTTKVQLLPILQR